MNLVLVNLFRYKISSGFSQFPLYACLPAIEPANSFHKILTLVVFCLQQGHIVSDVLIV